MVRSLWAVVQGSPVFMRRVNGWLAVFWVVMIPVSIWTGWVTSVTYVSARSLWALVSGHQGSGRCPDCRHEHEKERGTASQRGYGALVRLASRTSRGQARGSD